MALADLGHAEAGEKQVELAHALQAGDAEDLALAEIEAGIFQLAAGRRGRAPRAPARADADAIGGTRRKGLRDASGR